MTLRTTVSSLTAVMLMLPIAAFAALSYEVHTEVIRDDKTKHFAERVISDGINARVDFLNTEGKPYGSFMLTNDGGKTIAVREGAKSICSEWDRTEFFSTAATILYKGKRLVNAEISGVELQILKEEPGPELEGYPTRHVTLKTNYSGSGRFLFVKLNYEVEEIDNIWVTDALQVPEVESSWLQAAARSGNEFIDEHAQKWIDSTHGAILKHTNVVRLINEKSGKIDQKTEHLVIRNINELARSDIDPTLFEMPACKKVGKSEMKREAQRMLKKYIR